MKTTFEFDTEVLGEPTTLTVEVDATVVCDHGYGADADGNRGITAWFTDELSVKVLDEDGKDITKEVEIGFPNEFEKILDQAEDLAVNEAQDDSPPDADSYFIEEDR